MGAGVDVNLDWSYPQARPTSVSLVPSPSLITGVYSFPMTIAKLREGLGHNQGFSGHQDSSLYKL